MIVELHILQNFAPSCLNRDDTGSPKECEFGGYRRARISSQCIKRAIRDYFRDNSLVPAEFLASRTKLIADNLAKRLVGKGKDAGQAKNAISKALASLKLSLDKESKTAYLVFIGEKELADLSDIILKYWAQFQAKELPKEFEKELVGALDGGRAVDLALFGRMLADLPDKNIDAACQVAHAISTNRVNVEFDYYTAVDDLQPKETPGAGMIGTIEFNSACYYRYANIDLRQLKDNLGGDTELARRTVQAFLRAAVAAVPTGKQTSFSAQNPPDFVFAVVRDSGTWSLANAFAKPIREGDLIAHSVDALVYYWGKLVRAYGSDGIKAKPALALRDTKLDGMDSVTSFEELVGKVNQAISADC